jgi:adenylate cyclase
LESNAKPGQILISQAVYEKVKGRVEITSLGEITVKGKTHGINVFQIDGVHPSPKSGVAELEL